MKKTIAGLAIALAAAFIVLPAQTAHAYPDTVCTIEAPARVAPGESFDVTVRSGEPRDLTITYDGDTRAKPAATALTASFTAAAEGGSATLSATCGDDIASAQLSIGDGGAAAGDGADDEGALAGLLPDTGGMALWLVVLGAVLVLVGGTVAIRRQRA